MGVTCRNGIPHSEDTVHFLNGSCSLRKPGTYDFSTGSFLGSNAMNWLEEKLLSMGLERMSPTELFSDLDGATLRESNMLSSPSNPAATSVVFS